MKTISIKKLTLLSLFGITLFSCTMEKRLHRKGYHVQWNNNHSKSKATVSEKEKIKNTSAELVHKTHALVEETLIIKDSSLAQSNDKKELTDTTSLIPQENDLFIRKSNIDAVVASINKEEAVKLQKRIYSNTKRSGSKCVATKSQKFNNQHSLQAPEMFDDLGEIANEIAIYSVPIGAFVGLILGLVLPPMAGTSLFWSVMLYMISCAAIAYIIIYILVIIAVIALAIMLGYALIMGLAGAGDDY